MKDEAKTQDRANSDAKRPQHHPLLRLIFPIIVALIQLMGARFSLARINRDPHQHGATWNDNYSAINTVTALPWWAYMLLLAGPIALWWIQKAPRMVISIASGALIALAITDVPAAPAAWSVAIATFLWIRRIRQERLMAARQAQRAEADRRAGAERLRIAQELHDILAHHISLINVQSGVALHLADEHPEQARTALVAIKSASKEALSALRGALDALRNTNDSAPRSPTAGLARLDELVSSVRDTGLSVEVTVKGQQRALAQAADLAAFRVVQESLTNVLRHAQADSVRVLLDYTDTKLTIVIHDDGAGGLAVAGNGIAGMSERVATQGGNFTAGPAPDGGFIVTATIPF